MHIVHLETGKNLYGGARQVLMLLEGLADQGIRSTLVCPDDSAIATSADTGKVEIVTLPMRGDLDILFARRFGRWLANANADLVHVHSRRGADLWGGLAARPKSLRTVLTRRVDNPELPVLGSLKYGLYDRIIAISTAVHAQVIADGADENKLQVVHSAIDVAACQPTWNREQFAAAFECDRDQLIAVCVAQFIPRKGHADLLTAWDAVIKEHPAARLLMFGRGPEEQKLRQRLSRSSLENSVHFAGFRDDLRQFIGCADLLVHPALREGLGICLLEAQAAGVPVVACRAGGVPEAISEGKSAILTEPANPQALARAIIDLLGDEQRRRHMGEAGRANVTQHFSPQAMVSGNLAVYKELLN